MSGLEIAIIAIIVLLGFAFLMSIGLWSSKRIKTWEKKVAAEMGLNYGKGRGLSAAIKGIYSSMEGEYRKHHVEIYLTSNGENAYTGCWMQFENPKNIVMRLYKEGLFGKVGMKLGMQDIKVNDPEFDQKFVIKGNSPLSLQAILDPSIRKKIMNTKNFHILIDEKQPNVAHHRGKGYPMNVEKLRLILDLMIDIVEKIEKA